MSELLTNNMRKLFASLDTAKGRRDSGLFMAQGIKCVADTIDSFEVECLICNAEFAERHPDYEHLYRVLVAKNADLARISTMTTPPPVIAIYRIPEVAAPKLDGQLSVALDGIQDPGNLGTIMRVADWMGVRSIIASEDTVDVWNPKVVQATMGAISRVSVYYTDLAAFLQRCGNVDRFGTFLDGENIYDAALPQSGIVIMGNEGRGIRDNVAACVNRRLFIPPYPVGASTSESLNVAVATAIILSEFRRRIGR